MQNKMPFFSAPSESPFNNFPTPNAGKGIFINTEAVFHPNHKKLS